MAIKDILLGKIKSLTSRTKFSSFRKFILKPETKLAKGYGWTITGK